MIAKVHRDRIMATIHERYPYYQFDQNQGYGTTAHLLGLKNMVLHHIIEGHLCRSRIT